MRQLSAVLALSLAMAGAPPAGGQGLQSTDPEAGAPAGGAAALREALELLDGPGGGPRSLAEETHLCVVNTIACGQVWFGTVDIFGCVTSSGLTYFDVWAFNGLAGQQIQIDLASDDFDPFLLLIDPDGNLAATDDDSGPGLDARITGTLTQTGEWAFSVSGTPGLLQTGDYAVSLACTGGGGGGGGGGNCTPSDQVRCLQGGRFRVEVEWRDFEGRRGPGRLVTESSESAVLWFFNPSNWEMLIKVLNGCPINDRFWVFSAATTNVEFTLTVTDTQTGDRRTYFNPLGVSAPAITDTAAFATCP